MEEGVRVALLCFLLIGCHGNPASSRTGQNNGTRDHTGGRYYSLLNALQSVINQQKGTIKTSNAGISLWDRTDLSRNYPGRPVRHCADILAAGQKKSGVYTINPPGSPNLEVFCEMDTDGGGWTVFQRRTDGKVEFYRDWVEYRRGFGVAEGEHWLGLENLYLLTHTSPMELYIYLEDFDGNSRYAQYDSIAVSSEFLKYSLDLGSYHGNAGDAMARHRGQKFSTKDADNDIHSTHCATVYEGAWWYKDCYHANLNGKYRNGKTSDHKGVQWLKWRDKYSLKTSIMMMRPIYVNS